ncbi:hypothetical protein [Kitasatospora sp. NPDC056731]|uniref:hypothetical protein n=1 Tax=Kitasatospora sp. NPDC056731 TaxID=3155422 RepID=UPI0034170E81
MKFHHKAILRLVGGEVHVSTMHERTVPNPGKQFPVAIVGGTGNTTSDDTTGVLNYSVQ